MAEQWDLYTSSREKIGTSHTRGEKIPSNCFHVVVEIWTIVDNNRILLTQRHPDKPWGLLWECTGGSILKNESSLEGATREIFEEIGLVVNQNELTKIHEYISGDSIYDVYVSYQKSGTEQKVALQKSEVVDIRYVSYFDLLKLFSQSKIVPKLSYFLELVKSKKICLTIG